MESYLDLRKQCTRIIDTCSSLSESTILGPILLSLYINDLPMICPEAHIQMYADDAVIYVHAKTREQ